MEGKSVPLIKPPILIRKESTVDGTEEEDVQREEGKLGSDLVRQKWRKAKNVKPDSDDEYDTDIENEAENVADVINDGGVAAYTTACEMLRITPAQRVIDNLDTTCLELRYRNLGAKGAKALATALMQNATIETLILEENDLGGEGGAWLCDMLRDNTTITNLDLSKNNLSSIGAYALGEMLSMNSRLLRLDISENHFEDRDADNIARGIERNEDITCLNLNHNNFCEEGAVHLGRALGSNNAIETLDLSWNNIRHRGAVALCNGLKRNYCITVLSLAWNGFGFEGSVSLGEYIRGNKYLRELDISNNRINWEGAVLLAKALRENDTLESLRVGNNPLTMTGCLDLVEAVDSNHSVLGFIGFNGIPVNRKILYMTEIVQKSRPFSIEHDGLLDSDDVLGRRMVLRCDPLKLLIQFLSDKNIRPVDLFRAFDTTNQHRISREQFIQGLRKAEVPLDEYEMERVLNRLDSAKEGKISYQRLMKGVKEQMKLNRAEEKRKLSEKRELLDSQPRPSNSEMAFLESQSRLIDKTYHENPLEANSAVSFGSTSSINSLRINDSTSGRQKSTKVRILDPLPSDNQQID